MKAKVYVTLKKGVHDPQGEAVERALHGMGFAEVRGVRIGKYIELELGEGVAADAAQKRLNEMCEGLLANTVIESYHVEV